MLGFHRRVRSLIPVQALEEYDKLPRVSEEECYGEFEQAPLPVDEQECEIKGKHRRKQLTLIYLIFLAEAIMSSSLQPQFKILVENDEFCGNLSSSFLRSILDCAYSFGATAGICWGYIADRKGRRPVAIFGLFGMASCCFAMGFANDLISCTLFRFVAGLVSSSVFVVVLTMIGDLSLNAKERVLNVTKLPLVSAIGAVGPIIQGMIVSNIDSNMDFWQKFPALSGQIFCGTVVVTIAIKAAISLEETLCLDSPSMSETGVDCEKAAFLGQSFPDSPSSTSINIVDFIKPEPISINQFLQAPSLLILLSSFCLLSLHASSFDVLLPHLGQSSSQHGGMGLPCSWLGVIALLVRAISAAIIFLATPKIVTAYGLLQPYRVCSVAFTVLYTITPLLVYAFMCSSSLTAGISAAAILAKHFLGGGAQVLVVLLMLNATPDAYSTGTIVGLMQIGSLFKALAVAVSGASFYFSDDFSITTTNYALWTCLAIFGGLGAVLAWYVKEKMSVDVDLKSDVLTWETCFDIESMDELVIKH